MPAFLAPWFLVAGLAAAIPVAIHMLHRRTPAPILFSTVRFLQEALAETRRSRHLTHVAVLAMRMLILLLLAAAFARPKLQVSAWLPAGRRVVVLVVDASASMRCRNPEGGTSFELAKDWAGEVLGGLDSGDRVALVFPGGEDPFAMLAPGSNISAARRLLAETECGWQQARCARFLNELLDRLPAEDLALTPELHVFSDFQEEDWPPPALAALKSTLEKHRVSLFLNRATPERPANAGFRDVRLQPNAVLGSGTVRAIAAVGADPGFSGGNTVRMLRDGQTLDRDGINLAPGETAEAVLTTRATGSDDFFTAELRLGEDACRSDNAFHVCLPRMEAIPVLIVDGGEERGGGQDSFFVRRALRPGEASVTLFNPSTVGWLDFAGEDLARYRAVFVCNPPQLGDAAVVRLEQFAEGGGTAVIFPGDRRAVAEGLPRFAALKELRTERNEASSRSSMALISTETPGVAERRIGAALPELPSIPVRARLLFEALPEAVRPVFRYEDGAPFAVARRVGAGRVWALSVSAGREWSDWPLSPHFVVFLHELLRASFRDTAPSFMIEAGQPLSVPPFGREKVADFRLRGPDGVEQTATATRVGLDEPFAVTGLTVPGHWTVHSGDRSWQTGVNVPAAERPLRFVGPKPILSALQGTQVRSATSHAALREQIDALRRGRPLWPLLLIAAFALTVLEELVANVRSSTTGLIDGVRTALFGKAPAGGKTA